MRHGRGTFRRLTLAAAVALLVALVPGPVRAADGDLDPTFGDAGRVETTYPDGAAASGVAVQPDGAIVIAGWEGGRFSVARYLPGGTLDPDFGVGGLVTTPLGAKGDSASAVALQPNGRIVATGTDGGNRFVVIRYLTDGTLDTSFGGDGIVRTPRGAHFWGGEDLAIQPNGKIVVVGTAGESRVKTAFAMARFRVNGTKDPNFGDGGRVVTPFGSGQAHAVALQPMEGSSSRDRTPSGSRSHGTCRTGPSTGPSAVTGRSATGTRPIRRTTCTRTPWRSSPTAGSWRRVATTSGSWGSRGSFPTAGSIRRSAATAWSARTSRDPNRP